MDLNAFKADVARLNALVNGSADVTLSGGEVVASVPKTLADFRAKYLTDGSAETIDGVLSELSGDAQQLITQASDAVAAMRGTRPTTFGEAFEEPLMLHPGKRLGRYLSGFTDATWRSDRRDDAALPSVTQNAQGVWVSTDTTNVYAEAIDSSAVMYETDEGPCWGYLPIVPKRAPGIGWHSKFGGQRYLELNYGVGYAPHAERRTFIDVIRRRTGAHFGGVWVPNTSVSPVVPQYDNPILGARNIALAGSNYGNGSVHYVNSILIPIEVGFAEAQPIIVNNGFAPLYITAARIIS